MSLKRYAIISVLTLLAAIVLNAVLTRFGVPPVYGMILSLPAITAAVDAGARYAARQDTPLPKSEIWRLARLMTYVGVAVQILLGVIPFVALNPDKAHRMLTAFGPVDLSIAALILVAVIFVLNRVFFAIGLKNAAKAAR